MKILIATVILASVISFGCSVPNQKAEKVGRDFLCSIKERNYLEAYFLVESSIRKEGSFLAFANDFEPMYVELGRLTLIQEKTELNGNTWIGQFRFATEHNNDVTLTVRATGNTDAIKVDGYNVTMMTDSLGLVERKLDCAPALDLTNLIQNAKQEKLVILPFEMRQPPDDLIKAVRGIEKGDVIAFQGQANGAYLAKLSEEKPKLVEFLGAYPYQDSVYYLFELERKNGRFITMRVQLTGSEISSGGFYGCVSAKT